MRETQFIEQNKDKWAEFERTLTSPYQDPDKLKEIYIQVADDLSFSRTFYPNRSVRVYLNGLAQRIFLQVYRRPRSNGQRFLRFWTDELPRVIYESRRAFLLSFLAFLLAFVIGMLSSARDPDFPALLLGQSYIDMTEANIESGDPMAVYKARDQFGMSLGITFNNLFVAFLTFAFGAVFGIGTLAILISNGIMVGAFQYFFVQKGLFRESFLTIWTHGTLEIFAIIIAGAAGLTMGSGLLFPGTYARNKAFQQSARRGVKIMLGIVPVFILAGFIEGFLTRYTETPDWIRLLFIILCLLFVVLYFVVYPYVKARQHEFATLPMPDLPPTLEAPLSLNQIKTPGEIFAAVFAFLRTEFSRIAVISLFTAVVYTASVFLTAPAPADQLFYFPEGIFASLRNLGQFFVNPESPWVPFLSGTSLTLLTLLVQKRFIQKAVGQQHTISLPNLFLVMGGVAGFQLIMITKDWYTVFLVAALGGIILLWNYIAQLEIKNDENVPTLLVKSLGNQYARVLGLFLIMLLAGGLFFTILDTFFLWTYLELITWIIALPSGQMELFGQIFLTFVTIFLFHILYAMTVVAFGFLYHSLKEIRYGIHLSMQVQEIGETNKIRGIEREA